jgi:hypothetical protein
MRDPGAKVRRVARRQAADTWEEPVNVEITVTAGPRARTFTAWRMVAVVGVLSAIGVGGVSVALFGRASHPGSAFAVSREPPRCVNSAVSAAWPSEIDRGGSCWHYGVNLTTILRYVHGDWRMALAARSPSCPNPPLPAPVRAELVSCRR